MTSTTGPGVKGRDSRSRCCEFKSLTGEVYWLDTFHNNLLKGLFCLIEKTKIFKKEAGIH